MDTGRTGDSPESAAETLAHEARSRAAGRLLWFLHPAIDAPQEPTTARIAAAMIGGAAALAVGFVYVASIAAWHGLATVPLTLGTVEVAAHAMFFMVSLGLLAALAQIVFPAAVRDLEALRAQASCAPETLDLMAMALLRQSLRQHLSAVVPALALGSLHVLLLGPTSPYTGVWLAASICNLLLWVAMFQIAWPLVHNAQLYSLLGHCTRIDLYNPHLLTPFGRTAIRPCLFIIVLQCAYAILLLPDGLSPSPAILIGLTASTGLIVALFFMPLRGISRHIGQQRSRAIAALDARLADSFGNHPPGGEESSRSVLTEANALLDLRDRLARVSSWPVGLEGVRRLILYVVLVPLTWVGAALVEMAIDGRL